MVVYDGEKILVSLSSVHDSKLFELTAKYGGEYAENNSAFVFPLSNRLVKELSSFVSEGAWDINFSNLVKQTNEKFEKARNLQPQEFIKYEISDGQLRVTGSEKAVQQIYVSQIYDDTSQCFSRFGFDESKLIRVPLFDNIIDENELVSYPGLLPEMLEFCKQNCIPSTCVKDSRTHYDFQRKDWKYDELRCFFPKEFEYVEHQIRALQEMLKTNNGLIVAVTSAGKSKIISAFIRLSGLPTLVLENKVTLATQLMNDLRSDGVDCGICSGSKQKMGDSVVSTIQSVDKLGHYMNHFRCIIVDEVQNAAARTYQEFLKRFCAIPLKYGFSASPERKGDKVGYARIRRFFGPPIINVGSEELIENHVMAKPFIYLIKTKCQQGIDYHKSYSRWIIQNEYRNEQIVRIANQYKNGILILVNMIEHGVLLNSLLPGSKFISGTTEEEERIEVINEFEKEELPILIASEILKEGISITHMNALILACGGKSNVAIIQKIGRSLRYKKDEKTQVDVFDFLDEGNNFLYRHSKERVRIYRSSGYTDIKTVDNLGEFLNGFKKF